MKQRLSEGFSLIDSNWFITKEVDKKAIIL